MRVLLAVVCAALLAATASGAPRRTFVWPTSVEAEPDGSLLLVENGLQRVLRVDPATGSVRVVASGFAKAVAATQTARGVVVSDDTALRLGQRVLVRAASQIGPVTAVRGGVAYTTQTGALELAGGKVTRLAGGLFAPHGIAVARDGSVIVADTGHNRLLAIRGRVRVLARLKEPRGIAVEPSGRIDVVSAGRIQRFSASGKHLGAFGPRFADPYDVTVARDGSLYVIETAQSGWLVRLDRSGRIATVPTG
jgi:glucose/arabinose dehydrogenase